MRSAEGPCIIHEGEAPCIAQGTCCTNPTGYLLKIQPPRSKKARFHWLKMHFEYRFIDHKRCILSVAFRASSDLARSTEFRIPATDSKTNRPENARTHLPDDKSITRDVAYGFAGAIPNFSSNHCAMISISCGIVNHGCPPPGLTMSFTSVPASFSSFSIFCDCCNGTTSSASP